MLKSPKLIILAALLSGVLSAPSELLVAPSVAAPTPSATPPPAPPAPPKPVEKLLGHFETFFKAAKKDKRVHNIVLGAEKLHGSVLQPHEDWSFNATVGKRTKEKGFEDAPVLFLGETLQDVGGGMCQVSSTLHAAAIKTGVDIVRRQPHSRPSGYISLGLDSTVNYPKQCWGDKQDPNICYDLLLKNPYDFPLTIKTLTEDVGKKPPKNLYGPHRRLVVELWGVGPVAKVETKWKFYPSDPNFDSEYKRRWRKGWKLGTWTKKTQSGRPGVRGALVIDTVWPDGRKTHSFTVSRYKPVDEVWWVGRDWEGGDPWEQEPTL